ncbi:hypothetical protein ASPBRDRAFT_195600 [Aspergillus brasiliensis CBS 101740]|uniref:Uncharacterized protein n=1 Tax=Aspergillus brasiliensis (strain CBS 101740 / IMI 381727 / IBT 21946) TaxID=767769 RepID=A0A1L9UMR1_ASPBC|nr:hypothetical protein ASPBRDRAFT_195600 [Aspergillus brasiliensis CBS 101740]
MLSALLASLCPCSCTSPTPPPDTTTTTASTHHHHHHHNSTDPYLTQYETPPIPYPPAYTPHPNTQDLNEKTLALHLRDPPISSSSYHNDYFPRDEKHPYSTTTARNTTTNDDASSQISFPSTTHSYGNTSTATRETPPPPYSPTWRGHAEGEVEGVISPVPSLSFSGDGERSRSVSLSGRSSSGSWDNEDNGDGDGIAAPRAVYVAGFGNGRRWGDEGSSIGEEYYYGNGNGDMGRVSYESAGSGRRRSWGA